MIGVVPKAFEIMSFLKQMKVKMITREIANCDICLQPREMLLVEFGSVNLYFAFREKRLKGKLIFKSTETKKEL